MSTDRAYAYLSRMPIDRVEVKFGPLCLWRGQAEDYAIIRGGLQITALGYWRQTYRTFHTASYINVTAQSIAQAVTALIGGSVSTSTADIGSQGLTVSEIYQDVSIGDILTRLASFGSAGGAEWAVGINLSNRVVLQGAGTNSRTWYALAGPIFPKISLADVWNNVYVVYQDAAGTRITTAAASDSFSALRYGISKTKVARLQTPDSTLATQLRDWLLGRYAYARATVDVPVMMARNISGAHYPLWSIRPYDLISVIDIPHGSINRTFRITSTEYAVDSGRLKVSLDLPVVDLESMLTARLR